MWPRLDSGSPPGTPTPPQPRARMHQRNATTKSNNTKAKKAVADRRSIKYASKSRPTTLGTDDSSAMHAWKGTRRAPHGRRRDHLPAGVPKRQGRNASPARVTSCLSWGSSPISGKGQASHQHFGRRCASLHPMLQHLEKRPSTCRAWCRIAGEGQAPRHIALCRARGRPKISQHRMPRKASQVTLASEPPHVFLCCFNRKHKFQQAPTLSVGPCSSACMHARMRAFVCVRAFVTACCLLPLPANGFFKLVYCCFRGCLTPRKRCRQRRAAVRDHPKRGSARTWGVCAVHVCRNVSTFSELRLNDGGRVSDGKSHSLVRLRGTRGCESLEQQMPPLRGCSVCGR